MTKTKKLSANVHIIDLWGRLNDPGLWARDLWQALYKIVGARELENFDNFLIDLKEFQEKIAARTTFYWCYMGDGGFTRIAEEKWLISTFPADRVFKIEYYSNEKKGVKYLKITEIKC